MKTSLARRRRHRRNGGRPRRWRGLQGRHRASPRSSSGPSSCSVSSVRPPRWPATATTARASRTRATCSRTSTSPRRPSRLRSDRQDRARPLRPGQARGRRHTTRSRPWLIDATTAVEDKTFWENAGFDPVGIVSAAIDTASGNGRGASTITQQLVRARLLPPSAFEGSRYERKIREIIQSIRLTQEYPGHVEARRPDHDRLPEPELLRQPELRRQGRGARATSASTTCTKLTLAQAAILAGIPQSPTTFDLVKNAEETCAVKVAEGADCPSGKTQLEVPDTSAVVERRNKILDLMKTRSVLTAGQFTRTPTTKRPRRNRSSSDPPASANWLAPHFVWQVRHQLGVILCGEELADTCEKVDTGGYKVITTLDWKLQKKAEKWVKAAAIAPNRKDTAGYLRSINVSYSSWIRNLKGRGIYNAALGAVDYRTGEIMAYVGSGSYYEKAHGKKFQPQYDVLGDGWRQPGSAFKPINYLTGIEDKTMTASTMFMDVVTNFGGGWAPGDADLHERGPLRLRQAIQMSLNIPAIKAALDQRPGPRLRVRRARWASSRKSTKNPAGGSIGIGTARAPLHRPHQRLWRDRRQRRADAPDVDPHDRGQRRQGRLAGRRQDAATGPQAISPQARLHHEGHPPVEHRPAQQPVLVVAPGPVLGRQAPAGRPQDRYHEQRDRPRGDGLRRRRRRTRPHRPSSSAPGWATRTTAPRPTARWPSRPPPACGRRSSRTRCAASRSPSSKQAEGPRRGRGRRQQRDAARAVHPARRSPSTSSTARRPRRSTTQVGRRDRQGDRQALAGRLSRPEGHQGLHGPVRRRHRLAELAEVRSRLGGPGRRGLGVRGGPKGTPDGLLRFGGFFPFGATWGAPFAPTKKCPIGGPRADARARARARSRPAHCRPPPNRPGSRASAARSSSRTDGRQAPDCRRSADAWLTDGRSSPRRHPRRVRPDGGRGRAGARRPSTGPRRAAPPSRGRGRS